MIDSGVKIKGTLDITLTDEHGVAYTWTYKNLITTLGLSKIAGALTGTPISPAFAYLAIGTGTTPATVSDNSLDTEFIRVACNVSQGVGENANRATFYYLWNAGEVVETITEAGLFDAATAGTMFNRRVFNQITVNVDNTLEITWTIEFDNA